MLLFSETHYYCCIIVDSLPLFPVSLSPPHLACSLAQALYWGYIRTHCSFSALALVALAALWSDCSFWGNPQHKLPWQIHKRTQVNKMKVQHLFQAGTQNFSSNISGFKSWTQWMQSFEMIHRAVVIIVRI